MAGIFDWSTVASENTSIDSINTAPGMPVGNTDNVFRSMAALIRQSFATAMEGFLSGASSLPVANGGTGATSAANARTNLGLGSVAVEDTVPIANGGTGATTAAAALTALGAVSITSSSLAENGGYIVWSNGLKETWGYVDVGGNSAGTYTVPVAHTSWITPVNGNTVASGNPSQEENSGITSVSLSSIGLYNSENFTVRVYIHTKGV